MSAPQLLSRKANGAQPVIASKTDITHSASQPAAPEAGTTTTNTPAGDGAKKPKPVQEGEKVVIRRLPPGLTQDEFFTILGDEWKEGNGKIGWFSFHAGKVSRE